MPISPLTPENLPTDLTGHTVLTMVVMVDNTLTLTRVMFLGDLNDRQRHAGEAVPIRAVTLQHNHKGARSSLTVSPITWLKNLGLSHGSRGFHRSFENTEDNRRILEDIAKRNDYASYYRIIGVDMAAAIEYNRQQTLAFENAMKGFQ